MRALTPETPRQREVLAFLCRFIEKQGYAPSFKEIAKGIGIGSTNGVADHLRCLEKQGFIRRGVRRARAIRVMP